MMIFMRIHNPRGDLSVYLDKEAVSSLCFPAFHNAQFNIRSPPTVLHSFFLSSSAGERVRSRKGGLFALQLIKRKHFFFEDERIVLSFQPLWWRWNKRPTTRALGNFAKMRVIHGVFIFEHWNAVFCFHCWGPKQEKFLLPDDYIYMTENS